MGAARWNGPAPTAATHELAADSMSSTTQYIWMIGRHATSTTKGSSFVDGTPTGPMLPGIRMSIRVDTGLPADALTG
jgi:hypothetical protein